MENIEVLTHSAIRISGEKTIYFDPYDLKNNYSDADIVFVTHPHYDHFSSDDIKKVAKSDTYLVLPKEMENQISELNAIFVEPDKEYEVAGISFKTVRAYNIGKAFHPKEKNWVGYIVNINGKSVYVAGDTDVTEDNKKVKCDVALVPVGGTYTMNSSEAGELINIIKPQIAIPTHYGTVVGTEADAKDFISRIKKTASS